MKVGSVYVIRITPWHWLAIGFHPLECWMLDREDIEILELMRDRNDVGGEK